MKPTITYPDFAKLDLRMGRVLDATIPKGSEHLIRCVVDFGKELGEKIIFSGIKHWYSPKDLIGKTLPYLINLEPKKLMNENSQGMLIAAAPEEEPGKPIAVLLLPDQKVEPGTKII